MARRSKSKDKKVCGCHTKQISKGDQEGEICVIGWRSTRAGMIGYSAFPTKNTKEVFGKRSNRKWLTYMVVVTNQDSGNKTTYSGFYDPQSHKVMIPDLGSDGWVMKPNARRKVPGARGYVGPVK